MELDMTSLEGKSPIQEKMNLLQAASGNADPSPTPLVLPGWFLGKYNPVLIATVKTLFVLNHVLRAED